MYYDNHKSQVTKGEDAEKVFKNIAQIHDYRTYMPTLEQNKKQHIDIFLLKGNTICSVDIKTVCKYGHTVELKNNFGYDGSLYGSADIIAYVSNTNVILINRLSLLKMVEKRTKYLNPITLVGAPQLYTPYTRKEKYGWDDSWVLININDILRETKFTTWRIK